MYWSGFIFGIYVGVMLYPWLVRLEKWRNSGGRKRKEM